MAKKKIKLLAFTVLATVGVLANDISHISAPSLTAIQSAGITDQNIALVRGGSAMVVTAPKPASPQTAPSIPLVADTTVTYVESEAPAATEEVVETVTGETVVVTAPVATETVKEVEIGGQHYVSELFDIVAPPADRSVQRARALQIVASAYAIPVKERSSFFGTTYLPKRSVDRPKLMPIFISVEETLSLKQDAVETLISNRQIASFTARKPKPIMETLVVPRPDVVGELSASMRPLRSHAVAPQAVPFADLIGPLAIAAKKVAAPRMPRPVFNFETAVAANSDHVGSLLVSMRQLDAPRKTHAAVAVSLPVLANADHVGTLTVAAKTVERSVVQLPNWFSNEPLTQNANAVNYETIAQRTVSPFLMTKPSAYIEQPIFKNHDALSGELTPRQVFASNSPVFANGAFIGDLGISGRTFNLPAPVKPELAAVVEAVTARADVIGSLAVTARTIGPLPMAPIAPSSLAAAAGPAKQIVVLIDNKVAFARPLLSPLPARPGESILDTEPMSAKGGPTANAAIPLDKSQPGKAVASKAMPVLIGGKTEFSMELLKPMKPAVVVSNPLGLPLTPTKANAQQQQGYCDPNFVGEPIRFSQTVELRLEDLLNQLHARFGVNFIMGPNIGKFPINVKAGSIPWNVLLRSQLFISGVRARCIDSNTIELVENSLLPNLQDSAGVETRFVKLKFLQRTGGGTVDLANRSQGGQNGGQGGCGGGGVGGGGGGGGEIASGGGGGGGGGRSGQTAAMQGSSRFDQLVQEIEKILGLRSLTPNGSGGGTIEGEERRTDRFVTQIPGRNILAIRATDDEHALISQIIERADRPPFQVVIKGLVYSANQDRIRDIGVNITGSSVGGRNAGGIFGDTLGVGTLFDFSTIIGTFDFNVQATAFQQNGVISVKSRPFATVLDGLCTTLSVGTKLPIVIDGGLGGFGGITILNADNLLAVTPYVVDDENGNPVAVTLDLNLQANVIDSSITARGVPAVNSKNIQTQLLLGPDKTAILGGFSIDQDSKSVSKVPGLGDIPLIGELFKRRIQDQRLSRLYFAISAEVIPYPKAIEPVKVPGATTDPQTITEEMKKRAEAGEQKPVDPNAPYKKKDN